MKTKNIVLIGAASLSFAALPLLAAPADNDAAQRDQAAQAQPIPSLGELRRANQIIGANVKDDQGRKLGHVKDLGLDLQNGRIAMVILEIDKRVAMTSKMVALPSQSLVSSEITAGEFQYKGELNQFSTAPNFDCADWKDATESGRVLTVYQRFNASPYFAHEVDSAQKHDITKGRGQDRAYYSFNGENAMPHLGNVVQASKLIGSTAWNIQSEKIGKVNNFVLDLRAGRVVEVVLASGGFLGMDRELCGVPPQAFRLSKDGTVLGLDTTVEALKTAPHFKDNQWNRAMDADHITAVYTLYHVSPYFVMRDMNNDSAAQNVRERAPSPLENSNKTDLDITAQIRKAIMADDTLSISSHNVKIVTSDGKVTLIGQVPNDDERKTVGKIAAKVVSVENVDNQVGVKASTLAAPESTTPAGAP